MITHCDHLIIGAGPAGLQLAYDLARRQRDYLVIDAADHAGSFFDRYPRHRRLLSINKLYTGYDDPELNRRWDWNSLLCDEPALAFRHYSREYFPHADDLVRYLADFAAHYDLAIRYRARVTNIERKIDGFHVLDHEGRVVIARNLVIATGLAVPDTPNIPGIEYAEGYAQVSIEPSDFCDQRVLIIGKGNAAFETADNLIATTALIHLASPTPLDFAWRSHYVGNLRAVNNNLLDTYQLKSQNAIIDAAVSKITKAERGLSVQFDYAHANGEVEELVYDRVIACTGFRFDDTLFGRGTKPAAAHAGKFPAMGSDWQSTNIDGLYFAGVLSHSLDYKKKQSGFIHGFRYNVECLAKLLDERYHATPYPRARMACTGAGLAAAILADINRSSALWQQSGFLCSVIVREDDGTASYYENLPIALAQRRFAACPCYWLVWLDFGQELIDAAANVFAIERPHRFDTANADNSTGLHPIVAHAAHGRVVSVHHVIEDLYAVWKDERHHLRPLAAFLHATKAVDAPAVVDLAAPAT